MRYNFKNLKVTVVGMARSGLAAARLLKELGADITVLDCADSELLRRNRDKLRGESIRAEINADESQFLDKSDLVVISPGVAEDTKTIVFVKQKKIPIISEIELAFQNCRAPIIAVTGTNGKTTVTTLIGELLRANAKDVFVCGNIGCAFSSQVLNARKDDFIVLEVSSFQLEKIDEFKPSISVFLNFSPDHLDRYRDIEAYLEAKKRIYLNQGKGDCVFLNFSDDSLIRLKHEIKAPVLFFNTPQQQRENSNFNSNQKAVLAIASFLKLDEHKCRDALGNFKGLANRMEFVRSVGYIDFINDSKATNIDSTVWALSQIDKPIILIAGGRDKRGDFASLKPKIKERVKYMFVIGEAKEILYDTFSQQAVVFKADSLESATRLAYKQAKAGDCILLSPMCASFDMFLDYKDRGNRFKQIVNSLSKK